MEPEVGGVGGAVEQMRRLRAATAARIVALRRERDGIVASAA